jgi:nickel/cobalt transporter (NicO) family protein
MNNVVLTLIVAAAAVGSLHTVAPDHWMPFAAIGRARRWSLSRTARTTMICGFGHVTVSAALGIAALFAGLTVVHAIGSQLENQAIYLLMAFGTVYMIWGLLRKHHHHHHEHADRGLTEWSLFLLFCADPCVAVIPMIMAAATEGWGAVAMVVIAYEIATIATMVVFVSLARAGAQSLRSHWIDHYGHALAGAVILVTSVTVAILGI